jgi:hypothetical protein
MIDNTQSNRLWEAKLRGGVGHPKATPSSTEEERTLWIQDKYERRLFTPLKEGLVVLQVNEDHWQHQYLILTDKELDIYSVDEVPIPTSLLPFFSSSLRLPSGFLSRVKSQ